MLANNAILGKMMSKTYFAFKCNRNQVFVWPVRYFLTHWYVSLVPEMHWHLNPNLCKRFPFSFFLFSCEWFSINTSVCTEPTVAGSRTALHVRCSNHDHVRLLLCFSEFKHLIAFVFYQHHNFDLYIDV